MQSRIYQGSVRRDSPEKTEEPEKILRDLGCICAKNFVKKWDTDWRLCQKKGKAVWLSSVFQKEV